MKSIHVSKNESDQRLDKLLSKYLGTAPKSFIYKMLRKKNITLNGKKATGAEKVAEADEIKLFLSEETIDKFSKDVAEKTNYNIDIIYEDEHILLINKRAGVLSQKANEEDISLNEEIISYLLDKEKITTDELRSFKPSVCNRLDRNTSGIVLAGKSLIGLQTLSNILKERTIKKYYLCIVKGELTTKQNINGYLFKNESTNKVSILDKEKKGAFKITTEYEPLKTNNGYTLLKVKLITGRSHQIRAHLLSIGHPIIGDPKYGDKKVNEHFYKLYKLNHQFLHAGEIIFPTINGELKYLSDKTFCAPLYNKLETIKDELFN